MFRKSIWKVLLVSLLGWSQVIVAQERPEISLTEPLTIGETVEFESAILEETRKLNIYLPNGYSENESKKYPVIYLLDGSVDEDFIHICGLVQFGSFSWINMLPETIVVGIANVDRKRDFTYPSKNEEDKKGLPTSGGSAKFIEMLEKEIQPLVKEKYRATDQRTIIGQSLGGLLATEILFKKPDMFDNYIIVSPSLWWDDESMLKAGGESLPAGKNIYVGVGKEGDVMQRVANELFDKLKAASPADTQVSFKFFAHLDHGDSLHLAVYDAFETIFRTDDSR